MILNHVHYYIAKIEKKNFNPKQNRNDYAISFRFTNVSIFMRKGNYLDVQIILNNNASSDIESKIFCRRANKF